VTTGIHLDGSEDAATHSPPEDSRRGASSEGGSRDIRRAGNSGGCQRIVTTFGPELVRDRPRASRTVEGASQPDFGRRHRSGRVSPRASEFRGEVRASVPTEKVRGSNPLSSTRETGSDLRKRGSGPVSSCDGMYPLRTPATHATAVRRSSIPGAGRRGHAGGRASLHPFQALHRSLLTGIEKVSAGDVVGAGMAEDIQARS